jgi:hypothetical protein
MIIKSSFTCFACPPKTKPFDNYSCSCGTNSTWNSKTYTCKACPSGSKWINNFVCDCGTGKTWDITINNCVTTASVSSSCTANNNKCLKCSSLSNTLSSAVAVSLVKASN